MHVDGAVASDLAGAAEQAQAAEAAGYCAAWAAETNHDPFLPLTLAAEHTSRLGLGTAIAVAFARNPMTIASAAWDLNAYSKGRFVLGLGTQVKAHIERRYGMPWSHPAPRMREYVSALRAIWACWQDGTPLDFEGDFYRHTLMTPFFDPGRSEWGPPRVFIAAVGPAMTTVAAEVADGMLVHSFSTARYLREVTLPAVESGLTSSGRRRADFQLSYPLLVATGTTGAERDEAVAATRKQIAFYASTPAYRGVLDCHGWAGVHERLHALSKQGDWDAMAGLVDDAMLDAFAVVGAPEEIARSVARRVGDLVDRVTFHAPAGLDPDAAGQILVDLKSC